jgi:hypothetical protein
MANGEWNRGFVEDSVVRPAWISPALMRSSLLMGRIED